MIEMQIPEEEWESCGCGDIGYYQIGNEKSVDTFPCEFCKNNPRSVFFQRRLRETENKRKNQDEETSS